MDTKAFINDLRNVFYNNSAQGQKYAEVWLSNVDFGGLYYTDDYYVLNVKVDYQFDSYGDEVRKILRLLKDKAKEGLNHIFVVRVYGANEKRFCGRDDFLIYNGAVSC